jgi:hypothetical protein
MANSVEDFLNKQNEATLAPKETQAYTPYVQSSGLMTTIGAVLAPFRMGTEFITSKLIQLQNNYLSSEEATRLAQGNREGKSWTEFGENRAATVGQAVAGFGQNVDYRDAQKVQQKFSTGSNKFLSGGVDVVASIFLDPLNYLSAGTLKTLSAGVFGAGLVKRATRQAGKQSVLDGIPRIPSLNQVAVATDFNNVDNYMQALHEGLRMKVTGKENFLLRGSDEYINTVNKIMPYFKTYDEALGVSKLKSEADNESLYLQLGNDIYANDGVDLARWNFKTKRWNKVRNLHSSISGLAAAKEYEIRGVDLSHLALRTVNVESPLWSATKPDGETLNKDGIVRFTTLRTENGKYETVALEYSSYAELRGNPLLATPKMYVLRKKGILDTPEEVVDTPEGLLSVVYEQQKYDALRYAEESNLLISPGQITSADIEDLIAGGRGRGDRTAQAIRGIGETERFKTHKFYIFEATENSPKELYAVIKNKSGKNTSIYKVSFDETGKPVYSLIKRPKFNDVGLVSQKEIGKNDLSLEAVELRLSRMSNPDDYIPPQEFNNSLESIFEGEVAKEFGAAADQKLLDDLLEQVDNSTPEEFFKGRNVRRKEEVTETDPLDVPEYDLAWEEILPGNTPRIGSFKGSFVNLLGDKVDVWVPDSLMVSPKPMSIAEIDGEQLFVPIFKRKDEDLEGQLYSLNLDNEIAPLDDVRIEIANYIETQTKVEAELFKRFAGVSQEVANKKKEWALATIKDLQSSINEYSLQLRGVEKRIKDFKDYILANNANRTATPAENALDNSALEGLQAEAKSLENLIFKLRYKVKTQRESITPKTASNYDAEFEQSLWDDIETLKVNGFEQEMNDLARRMEAEGKRKMNVNFGYEFNRLDRGASVSLYMKIEHLDGFVDANVIKSEVIKLKEWFHPEESLSAFAFTKKAGAGPDDMPINYVRRGQNGYVLNDFLTDQISVNYQADADGVLIDTAWPVYINIDEASDLGYVRYNKAIVLEPWKYFDRFQNDMQRFIQASIKTSTKRRPGSSTTELNEVYRPDNYGQTMNMQSLLDDYEKYLDQFFNETEIDINRVTEKKLASEINKYMRKIYGGKLFPNEIDSLKKEIKRLKKEYQEEGITPKPEDVDPTDGRVNLSSFMINPINAEAAMSKALYYEMIVNGQLRTVQMPAFAKEKYIKDFFDILANIDAKNKGRYVVEEHDLLKGVTSFEELAKRIELDQDLFRHVEVEDLMRAESIQTPDVLKVAEQNRRADLDAKRAKQEEENAVNKAKQDMEKADEFKARTLRVIEQISREPITSFRYQRDIDFLSNMTKSPIVINGVQYPTAEHAFQALKFEDARIQRAIAEASTGAKAKTLGRTREYPIRQDWDTARVEVMEQVVLEKFKQNKLLGEKLLATGDTQLIEGNTWNDRFWGVPENGKGANLLGQVLMNVRRMLRGEEKIPYQMTGRTIDEHSAISATTPTATGAAPAANVVIHSGGADGADSLFAQIGDELGIPTKAYSFRGHTIEEGSPPNKAGFKGVRPALEERVIISDEELAAMAKDMSAAGANIHYAYDRYLPEGKKVTTDKLILRNAFQVNNADAVIAVGRFASKPNGNFRANVDGGTGWAVELGIIQKKPVYFYDVKTKKWGIFNYEINNWTPIEGLPPKFNNFAGIGSRNIPGGEQAVRDYLEQYRDGGPVSAKAPVTKEAATKMPKEVFVFGSNLQGIHGAGAAKTAAQEHGAIRGQGVGLQGQSYAIPTKETPYQNLGVAKIKPYIDEFVAFAKANPETTFNLTDIGLGLAGNEPQIIASMFDEVPSNIKFITPNSRLKAALDAKNKVSTGPILKVITREKDPAAVKKAVDSGAVYIGRYSNEYPYSGVYGNPYVVRAGDNVDAIVAEYKADLISVVKGEASPDSKLVKYHKDKYNIDISTEDGRAKFVAKLKELNGKEVVCAGKEPASQCHGNALSEVLEMINNGEI